MPDNDINFIPYFSLSPNTCTFYELPDISTCGERTEKQIQTSDNLLNNENKYNELSTHARKRLSNAIKYILFISSTKQIKGKMFMKKELNTEIEKTTGKQYTNGAKYKLTFITLTLPSKQAHTDEEIKKVPFANFLQTLRRKYNMKYYIWKAEKQNNGNIHFHIITNSFIHHKICVCSGTMQLILPVLNM